LISLVSKIVSATQNMSAGEIVIYNDNKKLVRRINNKITKASECTLEAGAVVERIKRLLARTKIEISIEYANDKPREDKLFEQQPGEVLMKICDTILKEKCTELEISESDNLTPIQQERIVDKNVNVLV